MANSGFRLGSTSAANCVDDRICEMANMFGRIYGSRWVSFICMNYMNTSTGSCVSRPYLLEERWQNLSRTKTFREPVQHTCETLHEGDLLLAGLRGEVRTIEEVERRHG